MTKTAMFEGRRFGAVDPSQLFTRLAFGLCGLIAAGTLVAALRMYAPLFDAPERPSTPPSIAETLSRWAPAADESVVSAPAEPVRLANPFDASEVFEFPQGTKLAEARAAVAETLLERARARYAQLDSRTASR